MKFPKEYIKISANKKDAKAGLCSVEFKNGDHFIIYIPSLNLSAYGNTYEEAEDMLVNVVIPDFFENLLLTPDNELYEELKNFGWHRSPYFKKSLTKVAHIDKEGILRDFDLSEDTELTERLLTV